MNDFLDNGLCEDELNHGDCMFDGLDCCGYDYDEDGDYDDYYEIAPGDTVLCTECLCKGTSLRNHALVLKKLHREIANQFDRLEENQMESMKIITIAKVILKKTH